MRILNWIILIWHLYAQTMQLSTAETDANNKLNNDAAAVVDSKNEPKILDYKSSFDEILKDLINNWQSPIVYLKSRGYLPKDMENMAELKLDESGAQLTNKEHINTKRMNKNKKKMKRKNAVNENYQKATGGPILQRSLRASSKNDSGIIGNVKDMFKQFFASKEKVNEKDIQSKLGIQLDINGIKANAKIKAKKHYDDVLQRLIQRSTVGMSNMPSIRKHKPNFKEEETTTFRAPIVQKPVYINWNEEHNKLPRVVERTLSMHSSSERSSTSSSSSSKMNNKEIMFPVQVPRFLNWDIENKRLVYASPNSKEDYINELVRIFGKNKNTERKEPQASLVMAKGETIGGEE